MPDKDGDEGKSTKSVVNKKQKQMMGEEGYDVARDQGKVRPSKDKKDATTMPVSKEIKKTRKVNKGPSALDVVKKKYKGQIMDELDLTQVAESFGGYIVEAPVDSQGNIIPKPGEADKTEKLIKKTRKSKPTSAMSGSKVKGTPKGPTLKPTTSGRKIGKKFSSAQPSTTTQKGLDIYKAGGPYVPDKTTFTGTGKSAPRMEPKPKGMTPTLPVKPKRERIPADTGSLKDAPKVKKRFSQLSQDIKGLKVDRDIEKRVANPKIASKIEPKIASKIEYGTVNYSKNKKFDQEISRRRSAETTRGDAINRSMGTSGSTEGAGGANTGIKPQKGKKISKGADFSGVSRKTGAMKSGPKVVKQLGRAPKLGGSVVKVVGKETKKAAAKTAAKAVTKTAAKKALQKGVAKSAAKAIPGLGSVIAGVEAGARALKGDFKGAALSAGEAIPGVGLGFAGANIARDVSRAKKAASAVKTITKAKRAKDAVKVATPTVVGSSADTIAQAKKGISNFAKTPAGKIAGIGGGVMTTSKLKNVKPDSFKPPAVKGGRTGRRSAKS